MSNNYQSSNNNNPLWYQVIDRFGFPTLVAVALAVGFVYYNGQVRIDRQADRTEFIAALKENTASVEKVADRVEKLGTHIASDHMEMRRR